MGRSYTQNMQLIIDKYRKAGQPWPTTTRHIAQWAIAHGLWKPQASKLLSLCADHISRAMREEYIIDPQGRKVRAKHAATIKKGDEQETLWEDIRTGNREHMAIAFQQRRRQIVGDCHQLKIDVDSFNDNQNSEQPIQMCLDFTEDVAEIEAATDYDAA